MTPISFQARLTDSMEKYIENRRKWIQYDKRDDLLERFDEIVDGIKTKMPEATVDLEFCNRNFHPYDDIFAVRMPRKELEIYAYSPQEMLVNASAHDKFRLVALQKVYNTLAGLEEAKKTYGMIKNS